MVYITIGQFCWGRADGPETSLAYAVREFNMRYCHHDKATFITYECEDDNADVDERNRIVAAPGSKVLKTHTRRIPRAYISAYRKAVHNLFWGSEVEFSTLESKTKHDEAWDYGDI